MRLKTLFLLCFAGLSCAFVFADTSGDAFSGRLPLVFELNQGQVDSHVRFLARTGVATAFLEPGRMVLAFPPETASLNPHGNARAISMELLGANRQAQSFGLNLLPGRSNYYVGRSSRGWHTAVPQYGKVMFTEVLPRVDLIYYGNSGNMEYDFVLRPGADPRGLRFHVSGADHLTLNRSGDLALRLGNDTLTLHKPVVYQEQSGVRHTIEVHYRLNGSTEVSIELGRYDLRAPLIVDPTLSYSTLIGSNMSTTVQGVAVDPSGDVLITGTTFATNYPAVNAFQSTNAGYTDVFVTKLSPAGDRILFSTYLGGSGFDTGRAIAVDTAGNAYITGNVGGQDFPTTPGAFMNTCPGVCNTPFISKFQSDGTLAYSTFMGGSNISAWAIAADSAGAAYITGTAASTDLPLVNAFQSTPAGGFVQKLNPAGSALDYSTYLGGGIDSGLGITVDSTGSAYVVGDTMASNFPVKNPIQMSLVGINPNAFITKFSPDGTSLIFSTYLGGTSPFFFSYDGDYAKGVSVDPMGNVHVVGTSSSCEFPLTLTALNTDCVNVGYDQKVFVLTLNPAGSQIMFSTFLRSGFAYGIATDATGNSYVTGTTTSNNFPVLNPIESTSQRSTSTSFISELDLTGKLKFSTYLGATSGGSQAAGIAVDSKGGIYVAGAGQGDFPLLNPIPSQILQSTYDTLFVSKISPKNQAQFSLSPRVSPTLALRNVSSAPLTISSITSSSNFVQGGTCGTSLAAGTGCTLILQGADDHKRTGTVTIASNAHMNPQTFTISKSPTGDSVGSVFAIFPLNFLFPSQLFGTTSALPQKILVQNLGLQAGAINSITASPASTFSQTNDCPAELNPGTSCTISVTYTASTVQDYGSVTIVHDPNMTQDYAFLEGFGTSSAVVASTPTVDFGSQFVGGAPLARMVNLTNSTPYPASITGVNTSTGFAQTNTCSRPLPPQGSCRVAVTYQPSTNQNASGTLTATNPGPGGGTSVTLSATGLINGDLTVVPIALDFPPTVINFTFGPSTVTVTNVSSSTIPVTQIQVGAPFSQTNNCSSLAPGASCQISVSFTPTQVGSFGGTLSLTYSGNGSPQLVNLTGTGTTILSFVPSPVIFGQQQVGTQSAPISFSVNNSSNQSITLNSFTVQGAEFTISQNSCPSQLKPFTGCFLDLIFTPGATGLRSGTLNIVASDYPQPHLISLQGTGIGIGQLSLSSTSLDFGTQKVGTVSPAQQVTLTNTGTGTVNFSSIVSSASFYPTTNTCGTSLAAGASCSVSVQFAPTLKGILVGTITINDDSAGNPHIVSLTGVGD